MYASIRLMPETISSGQGIKPALTFLPDDVIIVELKVPRETEQSPEVAAQFFANLTRIIRHSMMGKLLGQKTPTVTLEIVSYQQSIKFYLICTSSLQSYIESQLKAQYPLITLLPTADYLAQVWRTPGGFDAGQMILGNYPMYPLKTYRDFKEIDPLVSVLSILARAKADETMVIQYVLGPRDQSFRKAGYSFMEKAKAAAAEKSSVDEMALTQIKTKVAEVSMKAGIRLFTHASTHARAHELLQQLAGSFGGFANAEGNFFKFTKGPTFSKKGFLLSIPTRQYKYVPKGQSLSMSELATLWHMPNIKFGGLGAVAWSRSVVNEAPENLPTARLSEKDETNYFARTDHKGEIITFGIKRKDRRRHMYIVGKSGTGKSTLIANMAINDIRNREGMAIIDPHGDLVEDILNYIPSYRVNDIVYLDPSDSERSFSLNPLEVNNANQRELVVSGIIGIFAKIFGGPNGSWGPRLEYILRNALFALSEMPGATFVDIISILADKKYRQANLHKINDPVIRNFFENEFEKYSEKMQTESISPILNKVGQFVQSPTIRNIIGQPKSTINLEEMMNEGKIILVNLSQGRLGEDNAALLGAMIITKFQLAAMNRVNIPEDERRDFFLYVDEFQNFATSSFSKILSEARKYRLCLTMANQYTQQVPEDLLAAIYGNCGTIISFLVGADDAAKLSREFGGIYKDADITNLANYQIFLKLMIDSMASRPFSATTLPLPRSRTQNKDKAIRVSKQKYTKPLNVPSEEAHKENEPAMPRLQAPATSTRSQGHQPQRDYDRRGNHPSYNKPHDQNRPDNRPQHTQNARNYDQHAQSNASSQTQPSNQRIQQPSNIRPHLIGQTSEVNNATSQTSTTRSVDSGPSEFRKASGTQPKGNNLTHPDNNNNPNRQDNGGQHRNDGQRHHSHKSKQQHKPYHP